MVISKQGLDLIKRFEGLRLEAYQCSAGVWTIGYGHTGKDVKEGMQISKEKAEQLLLKDIEWAEGEVNSHGLHLKQHQFDALVSFVYNIGGTQFRKSTLLRKLKKDVNDYTIPNEFKKWVYAGGALSQGLINRREKESALFKGTAIDK